MITQCRKQKLKCKFTFFPTSASIIPSFTFIPLKKTLIKLHKLRFLLGNEFARGSPLCEHYGAAAAEAVVITATHYFLSECQNVVQVKNVTQGFPPAPNTMFSILSVGRGRQSSSN